MNELTTYEQRGGVVQHTTEGFWKFAQMVVKSGLAPKTLKTPEQVMIALQMGAELGFTPMQSLSAVAVINGKPSVWGDAAKALVERSPECEYVREWTEGSGESLTAYCEAKRRGRPQPHKASFSWADAKRAGLTSKDTYKQYPHRMLQMRARSFCLRDQFADLLCGFVLVEEAMDYPSIATPRIESGDVAPMETLDAVVNELEREPEVEKTPSRKLAEEVFNPPSKPADKLFADAPTPDEAPELYADYYQQGH